MKKLLCILSFCILLMVMLTACDTIGEVIDIQQDINLSINGTDPSETSQPTQPPHVCQAGDTLHMDRDYHYYTCQCGQPMDKEEHTLEDQICTVCEAKISNREVQGFNYVWLLDEQENVIRTQCYDHHNRMLRVYTFEYTYGDEGKILGKRSYADQVIYGDVTYDEQGNILTEKQFDAEGKVTKAYRHQRTFDENGLLVAMQTHCNDELIYTYHLDLVKRTAEEIRYSENGTATTKHYKFGQDGTLTQELRYKDGMLTHKLEYAVQRGETYLQKEYIYDAAGNYTFHLYDSREGLLAKKYLDANGDPVDYSDRFDADACAGLVGNWSGEVILDSSMVDMELPNFRLKAHVYMTLDASGTMTVVCTMDKEALRQTLITATTEALWDQIGRERTLEELDVIFRAEYGKNMQDYVRNYVDKTDMSKMLYNKARYVYFVEENILYSGDSWKTIPDGSMFTLKGDHLIFEDPDSELSITLTRGGTAPLPQKDDVKPNSLYDPVTCAPFVGTWEYTYTQTDSYAGASIEKTIRLTFTEDGVVKVQEIVDPEAYYEFMLAMYVEATYRQWSGYTREQVDEIYANMGTTTQDSTAANMEPLGELLPSDRYYQYYIDKEGYLIIGHTLTRYTVTDTVLTFLRYISATEDKKFPFTKVG